MHFFAQTTIELTPSSPDLTTSADPSGGAAGIGMGLLFLYLALIAFFIVCAAKIYMKAGRQWWEAIIPIYSTYVLLKIVGRPGWWLLLYFIPFVNIVVAIINMIDLAKAFGRGVGTGLALVFLPIIMYPIMAFGSSYKYKDTSGDNIPSGGGSSPDTGTAPGATIPKAGESNSSIGAGTVVGGAAGSASVTQDSGVNNSVNPSSAGANETGGNVSANGDYGTQSPDTQPVGVAQAPEETSAPTYPGEEPSTAPIQPEEPQTNDYQSESNEGENIQQPPADGEVSQPTPPAEEDSAPSSDNDSNDQNLGGGAAGPTFG